MYMYVIVYVTRVDISADGLGFKQSLYKVTHTFHNISKHNTLEIPGKTSNSGIHNILCYSIFKSTHCITMGKVKI